MIGHAEDVPFSHVLCWVDGSDEACRAAESAAHLAYTLQIKLSYLAVGTEPDRDQGFEEYSRIEGVSEPMALTLESGVHACLDQAMSIAARVGVKSAARLTRTGNATMAICDAARAQNADLVIIRKDKSNFIKRLIGDSVSYKVANGCEFSILMIG